MAITQIIIRFNFDLTDLKTNSQNKPVVKSKTPIIIKSERDQLTSFENCIAINGTSNRPAITIKITFSLLFFILRILNV